MLGDLSVYEWGKESERIRHYLLNLDPFFIVYEAVLSRMWNKKKFSTKGRGLKLISTLVCHFFLTQTQFGTSVVLALELLWLSNCLMVTFTVKNTSWSRLGKLLLKMYALLVQMTIIVFEEFHKVHAKCQLILYFVKLCLWTDWPRYFTLYFKSISWCFRVITLMDVILKLLTFLQFPTHAHFITFQYS